LFGSDADSFVQQLRLAAQAHRAGRLDEAIASYLRLLAVQPYHAELHNNLGVALRLVGKLEASVSHHRLSLAADPGNPALQSNLGNALRAANRLDEAVKHHFHSITLNRDYAEGFFNLALCLRDLGRVDEAVGCFSRSLALNPDNRRAKVELALALLMRGELAPGFAAYEARKRLPETPVPEFVQPAWDGGPIEGKRILLYPEQGLSDVLLFVRFARELKRRGATVLVLCQALLKELLATVDFIDTVVAEGEKLPEFDVHASMVSLPHLCRADFDALAAEPAYLHPPADSRIKLGRIDKAKLRIGIYWAAMPGQPITIETIRPAGRSTDVPGPQPVSSSIQSPAAVPRAKVTRTASQ
jgi:Tfp pilus assembly protein PilF